MQNSANEACRIANEPSSPVSVPQPVPTMKAQRRPKRREIAPVGKVPAASPSTYIDSGTVASDILGASVAPAIEPVAKITAELAPVSACAAARRTTLARARASSAISLAVTSIIGISAQTGLLIPGTMEGRGRGSNRRKRAQAMPLTQSGQL